MPGALGLIFGSPSAAAPSPLGSTLTASLGTNPVQAGDAGGRDWNGGASSNVFAVTRVLLEPSYRLISDAVVGATFIGPNGTAITGGAVTLAPLLGVAGAYSVAVSALPGVVRGRYLGVVVTIAEPGGTTLTIAETALRVV